MKYFWFSKTQYEQDKQFPMAGQTSFIYEYDGYGKRRERTIESKSCDFHQVLFNGRWHNFTLQHDHDLNLNEEDKKWLRPDSKLLVVLTDEEASTRTRYRPGLRRKEIIQNYKKHQEDVKRFS